MYNLLRKDTPSWKTSIHSPWSSTGSLQGCVPVTTQYCHCDQHQGVYKRTSSQILPSLFSKVFFCLSCEIPALQTLLLPQRALFHHPHLLCSTPPSSSAPGTIAIGRDYESFHQKKKAATKTTPTTQQTAPTRKPRLLCHEVKCNNDNNRSDM